MAVIVPSVLFGMVHILGMDFSIGSCLQVLVAGTMAGIMFSMIAIESGSVWNSGIVHAIWNIVMIGGGLAIGQKADQFSVMTYVLDAKSFAVTGGEFGMEASVISLVGYIIVTGVAFSGIKNYVISFTKRIVEVYMYKTVKRWMQGMAGSGCFNTLLEGKAPCLYAVCV